MRSCRGTLWVAKEERLLIGIAFGAVLSEAPIHPRLQLVEMAEPIDSLEDQEEQIEELKGEEMGKIMTSIAKEGTTPEVFGFELNEGFKWYKPRTEEIEDYAIPEAGDTGSGRCGNSRRKTRRRREP